MGIHNLKSYVLVTKQTNFKGLLLASFVITLYCGSCSNGERPISTTSQSMIEFPEEFMLDDKHDIPAYLDPDKILCDGKGLKVGKCISKQLKKGICLGIIRHEKRIYAIEIPCEDIKKNENSDSTLVEKILE